MHMKKKFKKSIFLFINIIVLFLINYVNIHASFNDNETKSINNDIIGNFKDEISEKSKISNFFEIESLRESNVKHFYLSDGTIQAISFGRNVHRNVDNKWIDIDNRIYLNNNCYQTLDDRLCYNANTTKNNELLNVNYDYNYSICTEKQLIVTDVQNDNFVVSESIESMIKIGNSSKIVYNDLSNTNIIDFFQSGDKLFAKIHLNSFQNGIIDFSIRTDEQIIVIDNSLCFFNEKDYAFSHKFSSPLILDEYGENIGSTQYTIINKVEDEYFIRINYYIDESIKINSTRFHPGPDIVIDDDPGQGGGTRPEVFDTYLSQNMPNTNYGQLGNMIVSSNNTNIALIKTTIPEVPNGSTIFESSLCIPYYYTNYSSNYIKIGTYQILDNWDENTVTWNTCPNISTSKIAETYTYATASYNNPSHVYIGIDDAVDNWYSGLNNNYGIAIKYEMGTESNLNLMTWESEIDSSVFLIHYNLNQLIVDEGIHFIKNGELENYVQIDDDDSNNNYNTENAILELWTGTGESFQKWIFEYLHNGYYKIESFRSGKVISVQNGYENNVCNLVQQTYNGNYKQQWKISLTNNNMYKIKPRSSENYSTDWVMCANDGIGSNGRNVKQREYNNNSYYKDEWIIENLNNKNVTLYAITNVGHDHYTYLNYSAQHLVSEGFNNIDLKNGVISASECLNDLKTCTVFASRSHGSVFTTEGDVALATAIVLNDQSDENCIKLWSHSVSHTAYSLFISDLDVFNNLDLALFIGCKIGYGGATGNNLPARVVSKGAKVAIGFAQTISCSDANIWTEYFFIKLSNGFTVAQAAQFACNEVSEGSGLQSIVIVGNSNYLI